MKRVTALGIAIALMLCLCMPVCVAEATNVVPRHIYAESVSAGIYVDEYGIAHCRGACVGKASAQVMITIAVSLDQYDSQTGEWEELITWEASAEDAVELNRMFLIELGSRYRVRTEGYIYNSSGVLLETVYAEESMYC